MITDTNVQIVITCLIMPVCTVTLRRMRQGLIILIESMLGIVNKFEFVS